MTIREGFLTASAQDITEFLSEFYKGTSEGDLINIDNSVGYMTKFI